MSSTKSRLDRINSRIAPVTLEYLRKFLNQACQDIYLLRNGLSHRIGAIIFHNDIMMDMIENISNDALNNPYEFHSDGKDLIYTFRMGYLFDDMIFNLMSFYDYLAGFVGYILYDEEIRSLAKDYDPLDPNEERVDHLREVLYKMSWTEIAKMSRESRKKKFLGFNENKFSGTELSENIQKHDEDFIERLSRYRNRLIHNESDLPNLNLTISTPGNSKIDFFTPATFESYFNKAPNDLEEALELLINSFTNSVGDVFDALEIYIENNRRVRRGNEFSQ